MTQPDEPSDFVRSLEALKPAAFASEAEIAAAADPGPCPACKAPRRTRDVRREGTGISPRVWYATEAYCPICELTADLPPAFRWASFASPALAQRVRRAEAIQEARDSCGKRRVVLVGPAGHGKTSLAAAMFRNRAERGEHNVFALAWRLGVARAQHPLGDGEPPVVAQAMRAPILVIDDVGMEKNLPTNALPDVIFERHAEGRPTWITTALTEKTMAERYGDGIARRVFEGARIIDCGGGA